MMLLAQGSYVKGPDYAVLVGYFVLMLAIGVFYYRYMRGMKDYFSGGNTIPWWLSGASFFMTSFSAFAFVYYSSLAFKYGWVSVTLYWVTVPATIFSVVFFAKKWRRARIDSPVEYLETRYSRGLRQLFTWQGVPVIMIDDALKLVAIGTFVAVSMNLPVVKSFTVLGVQVPLADMGLHTPLRYTMAVVAVIMLLYTLMGGLWAVAVTDFIQFVVQSVGIFVLLPLALYRVGGVGAFLDKAPKGFFQFVNTEYNWIYVGLLALLYCLTWSSVKWPLIQRYYCVRDEKEAVKVGWFVVFLNVVFPPLMFLPAMVAQQFPEFAGMAEEKVYPSLCVAVLPAGMLGLMIAAMFSATMSMLSGDYNACAGVLTNDVYRRLIHKKASQRELVLIGRLMTLVIGAFALLVAMIFGGTPGENIFRYMVTLFSIFTPPVAVAMILGLLSKRVTNASAMVGFVCGLTVSLGLFICFYGVFGFGPFFPDKVDTAILTGLVWSPAKDEMVFGAWRLKMEVILFACNTLVTLIATLVVALLKPMGAEEQEQVETFRQRLATPIGQLEEDRPAATVGRAIPSPFGVCGVCTLLIGALMLGVAYWVWKTGNPLAVGLDVGFGAALVLIGWLMARYSAPVKPQEADAAN